MPTSARRATLNAGIMLALFAILYSSYKFLPRNNHLSLLDITTGFFVLVMAEVAVLQSRKSRFRFRLAAQLPLLIHFGVFPVLLGQTVIILIEQIRDWWVTRTYSPHLLRILSAVFIPAVAGTVYYFVLSLGARGFFGVPGFFDPRGFLGSSGGSSVPSIATATAAIFASAAVFWLSMSISHLVPGRRTLTHPWDPMPGWLFMLLLLDAIMAFGAIVQQSLGHHGSEVAVTLELIALMGSMALYTDANIRKSQLVKLTTLVSELSSDTDWTQLAEHIFDGIRDIVVVDVAALWFRREDGRLYPFLVHAYDPQFQRLEQTVLSLRTGGIQLGQGLVGYTAASRDVVRVQSSRQQLLFEWDGLRKLSPSALATPVFVDGEVKAVLALHHASALSAYSNREQTLFRIFSKQLSSIFTMLWRYEQTKLQAEVDDLTGLYNYRFFDHALHQSVTKSDALHQPLTLLLIDLDHFKRVNDRYGHLAGNQVLIDVAKTLREMVRTDDIVARYGGEEFTVLLPGLSSIEGQAIAERIRSRVENMIFEIEPGLADATRPSLAQSGANRTRSVRLTLSIGVATYPDKADSPLTLIRHADRAMYVGSKQNGRNRVATYM